jgi:hypothetical protein
MVLGNLNLLIPNISWNSILNIIFKGEAGTLFAYEIYNIAPFMEQLKDDKELTAIEWGMGYLVCRTMMRIGIDGTK